MILKYQFCETSENVDSNAWRGACLRIHWTLSSPCGALVPRTLHKYNVIRSMTDGKRGVTPHVASSLPARRTSTSVILAASDAAQTPETPNKPRFHEYTTQCNVSGSTMGLLGGRIPRKRTPVLLFFFNVYIQRVGGGDRHQGKVHLLHQGQERARSVGERNSDRQQRRRAGSPAGSRRQGLR